MSGNETINERRTAIFMVAFRTALACLLLAHATSQLVACLRASRIISPVGLPDPVMLTNATVPIAILIGAVTIAIGFKTRFMAIAMIVFVAMATVLDLMLFGSPGSTLNWMARLSVMLSLVILFLLGAGALSIDALKEARLSVRTAQ